MGREHEARDVGAGRMKAHAVHGQPTPVGFEWMSFSGLMRLTGAAELLPPGATFWSALESVDRGRVREGLEQAVRSRRALSLTCGLATQRGVRSFQLEGEVISERVLAPRVIGVLVELRPDAGEGAPANALDALVAKLAGTLGKGADPAGQGPAVEPVTGEWPQAGAPEGAAA